MVNLWIVNGSDTSLKFVLRRFYEVSRKVINYIYWLKRRVDAQTNWL